MWHDARPKMCSGPGCRRKNIEIQAEDALLEPFMFCTIWIWSIIGKRT